MKTCLFGVLFLCVMCCPGFAQEEYEVTDDVKPASIPPAYQRQLFGETVLKYQKAVEEERNAKRTEAWGQYKENEAAALGYDDEEYDEWMEEAEDFDYGGVVQGKVIEHEFKVVNHTKNTLTITNVGTSCECTTASVAEKVLAPEASTMLSVKVDTTGQSGSLKQYVYVSTDDPAAPTRVFTFKAEVRKP